MKPLPDHGPTHEAGASCCTTFYEQDWVRVLANDIFHPGGAALTRRTARAMSLAPGHRLLDLGSGTGSSAGLLAEEFGLRVTGVDRSPDNVARASARWEAAAMGASLTFEAPRTIDPNAPLKLRYGLYIHADLKPTTDIETQYQSFTTHRPLSP